MNIGILDFGLKGNNESPIEVLEKLLYDVRYCEEHGFSRYWLGEHHLPGRAWASPIPLLSLLSASTKSIKIGIAGVLLDYHSPLNVAEDFKLLNTLFPKRIDLGIARGLASKDQTIRKELLDGRDPFNSDSDYGEKVIKVIRYLKDMYSVETPYAVPEGADVPIPWILGTGEKSSKIAAGLGTRFVFSFFFTNDGNPIRYYKENFQVSKYLESPDTIIAFRGTCVERYEDLRKLPRFSSHENAKIIEGTQEQFKEQLLEMETQYAVSEFVLLDTCMNHEDKLRSYKLVSEIL